jgi:hypothetical protein
MLEDPAAFAAALDRALAQILAVKGSGGAPPIQQTWTAKAHLSGGPEANVPFSPLRPERARPPRPARQRMEGRS